MKDRDRKILIDGEIYGIPTITFTAKDKLAIEALEHYEMRCKMEGCSKQFMDILSDRITEFKIYLTEHPYRMKLPD